MELEKLKKRQKYEIDTFIQVESTFFSSKSYDSSYLFVQTTYYVWVYIVDL